MKTKEDDEPVNRKIAELTEKEMEKVFAGNAGERYRIYKVKEGDTLASIAKYLNISQATLIIMNNIKDPDLIRVGQLLRYPA